MSELVGKLSQGVEYYKGDPGPKGDTGPRGEKGEPFRYEDFTPEQLESLKVVGPAGEPGVKGDKGDAFTYADFTQEQLEALRGPAGRDGINGRDGEDGVSITHTWNGTSLSITSASGTSEMDLKGEKGDQGQIGPQGPQGPAGSDYVLTQDDKTEIAGLVDLTNYATTTYVDNAVANIEIPEEIKHITITDATELLNLEDGFYIVDNEFIVNTVRDGEIIFSGTLSVKQDWQSYTFINTGAYLFYNNGDKTWDCSWSAWQEVVDTTISEALANSGFQTEEQVNTLINQALGVIENGTY